MSDFFKKCREKCFGKYQGKCFEKYFVNSFKKWFQKYYFHAACVLVLAGSVTGAGFLFKARRELGGADAFAVMSGIVQSITASDSLHNGSGIGGGDIIGSASAGSKQLPIYSVSTQDRRVALSFDAAWGADDTIQILDILDKYNVKVTFFMTGGWVDAFPDMVREIYSRGHDLGNHSQNHKQMSSLSVSGQAEEINSVTESVKELTGYTMFLFRPPYGDYNSTLINTCYSLNYYPIQWDVDSLDWKDYGVESIIKTVTQHKSLGNGSIVLMHNGAKFTADALESVITGLLSQGYELVPISELIIKENFHMDVTGRQIAD